MEFFEIVGNNILIALNQQEMTQKDLADKMNISKQVIGKIIKGQKAINALEIKKISNILNVSVDRLIDESTTSEVSKEPTLMFMGKVNNKNKKGIEFLNTVINELIILEEALND